MKKLMIGLLSLACVFSARSADRLVVAGGSLSEPVYAIGVGNRMVGIDEITSYPPETAAFSHIGYWKQLNSEGILSFHPGSFITRQDAGPQIVLNQLRAQKVDVVTSPRVPATVEQIYADIRELVTTLHIPDQGEALVNRLQQRLEHIKHSVATKNAPVKAMFTLSAGDSAPQIAGRGSIADAIMALADTQNIATHAQYKSYGAESLIAINPEVIVVMSQMVGGGLARLSAIAGIAHTAAWKNQHIVTVDQALIPGMGPHVTDAVGALYQQFWPH